MVPAFQRRRSRPQHHLGPLQAAPVDGQVTRRIACTFLLLVAGVVLFIDHDQLEIRKRRKYRHAGAQHNARRATVRGQPAGEALRVGHATVQRHHGIFAIQRHKSRFDALFQLRREVDLGHHQNGLCAGVARQQLLHALQVDLGLAAARRAKKQKWPGKCIKLGYSPCLFLRYSYKLSSIQFF